MKVLDGNRLYESGQEPVQFFLQEGHRSGKLVLIERFAGTWCDLKEVAATEHEKALTETARDKVGSGVLLVLEGRFQMADTVNANNRIYPGTLWDRILSDTDLRKKVENGEMLGECDHPRDGETLLQRVACMVTNFGRNPEDAKEIIGRIVVFDTAAGRNIKAIHEGGGRIGVSSRGQGSVVRQDGVDIVQDDYELETWDIVHNPSTPGAYPEAKTESREGKFAESKEIKPMGRLQELADRFERCRKRASTQLSADALAIIKEDVASVKNTLVTEDFSKEGTKAAALVAEVVAFQSKIGEADAPPFGEPQKEGDDADKATDLPTEADDAPPTGAQPPLKAESRATTVDETIGVLRRHYTGRTADVREATRIARESYRDAVRLEGPLSKSELEGISQFVREVVKTKPAPRRESTINATIVQGGKRQSKTYTSEDALREDLKRMNGVTIVEVDRADQIYEECARKFEPLLESQTIKALNAVAETAKIRAGKTALSAKVAAAVQVVDSLTARCNKAEKALTETQRDLNSAVKLIDALVEEGGVEKLRGAVMAIAATHPHLSGLSEALSRTSNLEEAIQATNRLMLESLPEIPREPIAARRQKFEEAVQKSNKAQAETEQRLSGEQFVEAGMRGISRLTEDVVELMQKRGLGR